MVLSTSTAFLFGLIFVVDVTIDWDDFVVVAVSADVEVAVVASSFVS